VLPFWKILRAERCRVVDVVAQVELTRLFGEREIGDAADAGIATNPGGISLKVTEPHSAGPSVAIEDLTSYISERFRIFSVS
jgi:hypothetical protein